METLIYLTVPMVAATSGQTRSPFPFCVYSLLTLLRFEPSFTESFGLKFT